MKIDIIGSFKSLSTQKIEEIIEELAKTLSVPQTSLLEIIAVSDLKIKELNKKYRSKDEITDVLSFPIAQNSANDENIFGTIVVAEEYSLENNENVTELIKHGFLHLAGYDHESNEAKWNEAAKKVNHNRL